MNSLKASPVLQLLVLLLDCDGVLSKDPFCTTDACKAVAHILEHSMSDHKVDPCKDFFNYSCGRYIRDKPNIRRNAEIKEDLDKKLQIVLDKAQEKPDSNRPTNMPESVLELLTGVYRQCKNLQEDDLNNGWAREVRDAIIRLGGIPLFTKDSPECSDSKNFSIFLAKSHKQNMHYYAVKTEAAPAFFTPFVETISYYKRGTIMKLDVQRSPTLQDILFTYYETIMKEYVKGIGELDLYTRDFEDYIYDIYNYERRLLGMTQLDPKDMSFDTLKQQTYEIDLDTYMKELLPESKADYFSDESARQIRILEPQYFERMKNFFDYYDDCLKYNYVYLKLIEGSYLVRNESDKKQKCASALANSPLKQAVASLYLQTEYGANSWDDVKPMARTVKNAMGILIRNATWIQEAKTREVGLKKLGRMEMITGASDVFYSETTISKFYSNIVSDTTKNYFENRRRLGEWYMERVMLRLNVKDSLCVNDVWYETFALKVNAHYYNAYNRLVIMPGIMLEPFYSQDHPKFFSYGYIGSVIGHEITHGFDSTGRKYGKGGELNNWWDDSSSRIYNEKSECFVQQYSKIHVDQVGRNVSGRRTLTENIADNGGLRSSFMAYKTWLAKNPDKRLGGPGFSILDDLTPEKLFFISFAIHRCSSFTDEGMEEMLQNVHPPGRYRVNIPLANFDEFHKVFQCKIGTEMNPGPEDQCRIW